MPELKNVDLIKVGSRKSQLALVQTNLVCDQLRSLHPDIQLEVVTMETLGDKTLDKALSKIGEKSLFTRELELALQQGEVDLVVHSLKDLPTVLPPGMVIGAISRREDPSDAVVIKKSLSHSKLQDLPPNSVVGTSSLRRIAQLMASHPHLKFETIRGNLNTRLSKLDQNDDYSAIVLATAGLQRMGWHDRISQVLSSEECLHAVGQGALAVECRAEDTRILSLLSRLCHHETLLCCLAERAFMRTLEGGCSVPVAVASSCSANQLELTGAVFSLDGSKQLKDSVSETLPVSSSTGADQNGNSEKTEDDPSAATTKKEEEPLCGVVAPHLPYPLLQAAHEAGHTLANCYIQGPGSSWTRFSNLPSDDRPTHPCVHSQMNSSLCGC